MDTISVIALSLAVIAGGLIMRMYERKLLKRKFSSQLAALANMYDLMQETLIHTGANLFLVFRTENSGQAIQPGSVIYLTIAHEDYDHIGKGLKKNYQRILADKGDINTIAELNDNSRINYKVTDMPFSQLKKSLMAKGMKNVVLFQIHDTGSTYYFGCIASAEEKAFFNDNVKDTKTDFSINRLRDIFDKIKK